MTNTETASRFLMQATQGASATLINKVAEQGIPAWLDGQLAQPFKKNDGLESDTRQVWQYFRQRLVSRHGESGINGDGNNPALPYKWYFHMAWWHRCLSDREDLLRQRVAQALSELLVISDNSVLELDAIGMANYYDLLYRHAFGSYEDLLYDVSMHPCMGVYLSHMHNQKADPSRHIHPDENYAREIMQLFSIGLFDLNMDGSRKHDGNGVPVPSYDNRDIRELARVFTGLLPHSYEYEWETSFWDSSFNGYKTAFDDGIEKAYKSPPFINMTKEMRIDEDYHDRGAKSLLRGRIKLPGGQDGRTEIRAVVAGLVAHSNTAPYVASHLIKRLVTSNPSKAYVKAVAEKFGPSGDLKAVVREILTWPLTRPVSDIQLVSARMEKGKPVQSQKLKSPLQRMTQVLRAFNMGNDSGKMWVTGDDVQELTQQHPLSSPTVFNFYKADYVPHGPIEDAGMLAPEFELHTSATSIAWVNMMYFWFFGEQYPAVSTKVSDDPDAPMIAELRNDSLQSNKRDQLRPDFSVEMKMAANPGRHDELIDHMSLVLTGKRNLAIKPAIRKAFHHYRDEPAWVVQTVAFMLTISPEFTIQEA